MRSTLIFNYLNLNYYNSYFKIYFSTHTYVLLIQKLPTAYYKYTAAYTVIVEKLHHNYTAVYKTKQLIAYNSPVLELYSIFYNSYTAIE